MTREEFLDMYEFVRKYSNFGSYTNNSSLPLLLSTQIVNTYISDKTIDTVKEIFNSHKDTKEWSEYAREKIFINKFKDIKYGSVTEKKVFHDKMNEMLSQTISMVDGGQDIFYSIIAKTTRFMSGCRRAVGFTVRPPFAKPPKR